jgi:hypothetical protein
VAALACGLTLVACDTLLGLDQFHDVACAASCPDASDSSSGIVFGYDAGPDVDAAARDAMPDVADADAGDAADGGDAPLDDGPLDVAAPDAWPVPTGNETWAHWPMPNPDAALGPDGEPPPPNLMAYDAGADASADGGSPAAVDTVTGLAWVRASWPASTYDAAWLACTAHSLPSSPVGASWRVPTRIELVSLIDSTRQPTIDPVVFAGAQNAKYWTSSSVPGDGGPSGWWTVDFSSGLVSIVPTGAPSPTYVLCVSGGAQ